MFPRIEINKEAFDHLINLETAIINYLEGKLPNLEFKRSNSVGMKEAHDKAIENHKEVLEKYKAKKLEYMPRQKFYLEDDMLLDFALQSDIYEDEFKWAYENKPNDLLLCEIHPWKSIEYLKKILDENRGHEEKMMKKK